MRTLKVALLWLLFLGIGGYAIGYKVIYMGEADIWYSDQHYGHPDKIEQIWIGVRGVSFGNDTFIGGQWEKENLFTKLDQAQRLFAKYKLLEQIDVTSKERVGRVDVIIIRHVPRSPEKQIKFRIYDDGLYRINNGVQSLEETLLTTAETFSAKIDWLKNYLRSENGLWKLKNIGIFPESGISELMILVTK